MNPIITIIQGDAIEKLRGLANGSVHCCVTSPPYWGLRDYGVAGQLGLEKTPEEYVTKMVEVFREVRRVLRDDGTLWLNLGDSYAAGKCGRDDSGDNGIFAGPRIEPKQRNAPDGLKPKDLCGIPWRVAFALQEPYRNWQIKTEAMRAWVGGIVDGEGCITILETKSSHSESLSYPPVVQVRMCDIEPLERLVQVVGSSYGNPQHPPSHISGNRRQSWQWKVVSDQAQNVIAEIYPFLTCKRKQAIVAWNHQAFRSGRGNQTRKPGEIEKEQFCKTLINQLNQREPVDIPSWMKEPSISYEPGWYLRQDCIWAKPNPMPESVTDRCTKAHEYIFLLSKSARYYFDAEAIKEPIQSDRKPSRKAKWNGAGCLELRAAGAPYDGTGNERNRRSVWTVPSNPYSEAHFATFPPDLIRPCILAGTSARGCCQKCGAPWDRVVETSGSSWGERKANGHPMRYGIDCVELLSRTTVGKSVSKTTGWEPGCECGYGQLQPCTVLDPFGGSGTTGMVALELGRKAVLIELNPAYVKLAEHRTNVTPGLQLA